jgi:hypothetical protein
MYNAFLGFSELDHEVVKSFMGYDRETSERFWNMSIRKYLNDADDSVCKDLENKARVIGYMRLLRRTIRRPDEDGAQEKIAFYKEKLIEVIDKVDTLEF